MSHGVRTLCEKKSLTQSCGGFLVSERDGSEAHAARGRDGRQV